MSEANSEKDLLAVFEALSLEEKQRLINLREESSSRSPDNSAPSPSSATKSSVIDVSHGLIGDVTTGDVAGGNITKDVYIIAQAVFGPLASQDQQKQIERYLLRLANKLSHLRLLGVAQQPAQGEEIRLARVYTQATIANQNAFLTEFIAQHNHVVLLGEPGSGKSTFLRYLALACAQRGLDNNDTSVVLPGWPKGQAVLPIIVPLRALAGQIAQRGAEPGAVRTALISEIQALDIKNAEYLLDAALDKNIALILFDGLDEVPIERIANVSASRQDTATTVYNFMTLHNKCRAIITCRTRAFNAAFQPPADWQTATIAPFSASQIHEFAEAWHNELAAKGEINPAKTNTLSRMLIERIGNHPRLQAMAKVPLLLTLMAFVLLKNDTLPFNRPQLYERILNLLLGEWDSLKGDQQTLADAVGLLNWDISHFLPLIEELSFKAHAEAVSDDGRGRLERGGLYNRLIEYFQNLGIKDYWGATGRFLEYIEQRSGLLVPDASDSYVFAHLTLQEYCASRYIKELEEPIELIMKYRRDDRWREIIFLAAGSFRPYVRRALLEALVRDVDEVNQIKSTEQRYYDFVLAAEIGDDTHWQTISDKSDKINALKEAIRPGLQDLLRDKLQQLPITERIRAGFLLGTLNDARYPVALEAWLSEIGIQADTVDQGYFRRVEAGEYQIGGPVSDPEADNDEQPQHTITIAHPFLISRFLITNEQWRSWAKIPDLPQDRNQPVVDVSWDEADEFCRWLSSNLKHTVRLPTEYEWEAAAHGQEARRYPWGNEWQADHGAYAREQEGQRWETALPVGCYPAGAAPCGALDLAGNVWEWTADYRADYPRAASTFVDQSRRMIRGGAFDSDRVFLRCSARSSADPTTGASNIGFRVVVDLSPAPTEASTTLLRDSTMLPHPDALAADLAAALPPELQAAAPILADLIVILAADPAAEPGLGTAAPELAASLQALAGRSVPVGSSLISFGADAQLGDVTIGDVAGGNLVSLSISITRDERTTQTVTAGNGGTISQVVQISGSGNTIIVGGGNANPAAVTTPPNLPALADGATIFLASGGTNSIALDALALHLRLRGLRVWREPEIGDRTRRAYDHALASIDAAIIALTPESCESDRLLRVELPAIWARFADPASPFWVVPLLDGVSERIADRTLSSGDLRSTDLRAFALGAAQDGRETQLVEIARLLLQTLLMPRLQQAIARHGGLDLHLFTHPAAGTTGRADLVLDWEARFGTRAQPRWPDRDEWSALLLPALADVRALIGASKVARLRIDGNFHLSAGYALGHQFVSTTKIMPEVWAATSNEWWGMEQSGQSGPGLEMTVEPLDGPTGDEVTIELSLTQDAGAGVEAYLASSPLPLARRVQLASPPVSQGQLQAARRFVVSPAHAAALADQIANVILLQNRASAIHLFGPLPQALAVMVGARLNTARPVQCYEYERASGTYVPSCFLR